MHQEKGGRKGDPDKCGFGWSTEHWRAALILLRSERSLTFSVSESELERRYFEMSDE